MEDCYDILGVTPDASVAEVKRAFRLKAKQLHPDVNSLVDTANEDFNRLLRAYRVLSDAMDRSEFDLFYKTSYKNNNKTYESFDYREWLVSRTDYASRSKLIFFDLLHSRENDAVNEYKRLILLEGDFFLRDCFDRDDFMDCAFILAEELYFRRDYYESFLLLHEIILLEKEKPYFKLFFPEVLILVKDIVRTKIAHIGNVELEIDAWEAALDVGFSPKDDAFFLRKMAEGYISLNDIVTARVCISEAKKLDPSVCIPKSILKHLGAV